MVTKDGPGPGQYDPFIDCKATVQNINMTEKTKCKFESYVPRYLDKVVENERRQVGYIRRLIYSRCRTDLYIPDCNHNCKFIHHQENFVGGAILIHSYQ